VAARRRKLKMTAAALAKRTGKLGYPISRVAIGKIETNHREGKFDAAELLALARALETTPISLLFPGEPTDRVEILPGLTTSKVDAIAWFNGSLGPIWPVAEAAELTEKLNQIATAVGHMSATAAPTTAAITGTVGVADTAKRAPEKETK
jgi:transcriptional regulator with XRE-family HTH domain